MIKLTDITLPLINNAPTSLLEIFVVAVIIFIFCYIMFSNNSE